MEDDGTFISWTHWCQKHDIEYRSESDPESDSFVGPIARKIAAQRRDAGCIGLGGSADSDCAMIRDVHGSPTPFLPPQDLSHQQLSLDYTDENPVGFSLGTTASCGLVSADVCRGAADVSALVSKRRTPYGTHIDAE